MPATCPCQILTPTTSEGVGSIRGRIHTKVHQIVAEELQEVLRSLPNLVSGKTQSKGGQIPLGGYQSRPDRQKPSSEICNHGRSCKLPTIRQVHELDKDTPHLLARHEGQKA